MGGADSDDTDNGAIDGGDDPALPELLADEHGGENGQNARQIIKPDDVEHIKHVGSMRQEQLKRTICWRKFTSATFLLLRWRSLMPGKDPTIPGSSAKERTHNVWTDAFLSHEVQLRCQPQGEHLAEDGVRMSVTHSKYSV